MNKKELIYQLRTAKSAHVSWKSNIQAMLNGFDIKPETSAPILATATEFGQWYYGNGQKLSSLNNYRQIDRLVVLVHQVYMEIYKLLFGEVKGSLFKSKAKIKQENLEKARELFINLNGVSNELLQILNYLEKEIMEMPESELEKLV